MKWSLSFPTAAAAAGLACAGNPPPPVTAVVPAVAAAPAASTAPGRASPAAPATLSDARVLELGRNYAALFQAREYDQLWSHLTPEAHARLGTLASFRAWADRNLDGLGVEQRVIRESVELPREGVRADRLYLRLSRHGEASARLAIGLRNVGSIVGMQLRRGD